VKDPEGNNIEVVCYARATGKKPAAPATKKPVRTTSKRR
jgi:hypothetical protein